MKLKLHSLDQWVAYHTGELKRVAWTTRTHPGTEIPLIHVYWNGGKLAVFRVKFLSTCHIDEWSRYREFGFFSKKAFQAAYPMGIQGLCAEVEYDMPNVPAHRKGFNDTRVRDCEPN